MASISNPWKGLSSYTEGEIIYGRDKDIENLFTLITTNKEITILYGQSGIGKTSLLRAGLFPWLRSSHIFPVYVRLGHDELDKSYVDQVIESVEEEAQKYDLVQTDLTNDTDKPKSLWEYLHRYDFHTAEGEKCVPMIFFDQFEELFTISSHRTKYVDEFIKDLGNILNETTPDYLLASTKGKPESNISEEERNVDRDKEPDLNLDIDLEIDEEEDNSKFKTQRDFLLAISIREDYIYNLDKISSSIPALKRNRYFLHGLDQTGAREVIKCPVKNLVDDHVTNEIIEVCHNDNEKYISPAFLSLLMYNLFDRMQQKGMSTISSSLVKGSIGDIFYSYYVNAIKGLPENTIDFLEDRLVSKGGFRLAVPVSDANAAGVTDKEIDQLESKRLIVRSKRGSHDFIELTHDLLCKEIAKDREERDEVKRRNKSKRRSLILVSMLAILLAILVTFKYQSAQLAKKQSALYMNQSRAVAAKAEQLIDQGDTYTATMLALEVLPEDLNKPNRPYTAEAERALRRSVLASDPTIYTPSSIDCMQISPDGKTMAVSFEDGSLSLWNLETGLQKWRTASNIFNVPSISFSNDGKKIAASCADNSIILYESETGDTIGLPIKGHLSHISSLRYSPNGKKIISGSLDGEICLWDTKTQKRIGLPINTLSSGVTSLEFSPDGEKFASGTESGEICIWDSQTKELIGSPLKGHNSIVDQIVFSPDGTRLTSVSKDLNLIIWDIDTQKKIGGIEERIVKGIPILFNFLVCSPDGEKIATLTRNGSINIEELNTHENIVKLFNDYSQNYIFEDYETNQYEHKSIISNIIFNNEGDKIYYTIDNTIQSWNLYNDNPICIFPKSERMEYQTTISQDGKSIAFNYLDSIIVRNPISGEIIGTPIVGGKEDCFTMIEISPDGKRIASRSWDNTLRIWDIISGKQIGKNFYDSIHQFKTLNFSPDGRMLNSSSLENTLNIWNLKTGEQFFKQLEGHTSIVEFAPFSPDGKKIITASCQNIIIYDANSLEQIGETINVSNELIQGIAMSPGGSELVVSTTKGLYIYDIETGNRIKTSISGTIIPQGDIFSGNGKYFVSFYYDGTSCEIRIFDTKTGQNLLTIPYERYSQPKICSFYEKGRKILAIHYPGEVYSFEFKPLQELMDEQRERFKDRKLTPEERRQYYLE